MRLSNATTAAIIATVLALCAGPLSAQVLAASQGRVVNLKGSLSVRRAGLPARAVALNETVAIGDELVTDARSEATIRTSDGSTVHIYPDSRVILNQQSMGISDFLHLFFGCIKVHVEKLGGRPNPHSMTTPTAVIAVRGTTFSVFVDDTDATLVAVDEGVVAVANRNNPSNELVLRPGQRTWVRGNQPPLRAQAFRGSSEYADMMPGADAMNGMAGSGRMAMGGAMDARPGSALSGHMPGTGGMAGAACPHH
jgi:ferric-dicitrate binding protein FerR (iron transport regulator)